MSKNIITAGGGSGPKITSDIRPPEQSEGKIGDIWFDIAEKHIYVKDNSALYTQVDWLGSNGNQYIELPFGFNPSDSVTLICSLGTTSDDNFLVAPKSWNTNSNKFAMGGGNGGLGVGFGSIGTNSSRLSPVTALVTDQKFTWTYSNRLFRLTELNLSYNVSSASFGADSANLRLFFGYNSNTPGKIYRYQHSKNGQLICDLIPVYRNTDNKPGFLDIINNVFYTNQGSSEFDYGTTIFQLPSNYQQVEYLESTGTQYINTNTKLRTTIYSELWALTTTVPSGWHTGFGYASSSSGYPYALWFEGGDMYYYTDDSYYITTLGDYQYFYAGFQCPEDNDNTISIFKANGSPGYPNFPMRLFGCAIWNGTSAADAKLINNLVPAYSSSARAYGLYDTVNNQFLTNAGTGTFGYGDYVSDYVDFGTDGRWVQIV